MRTLLPALCLALLAPGCRFGNYVEDTPQQKGKVSVEYYETQPDSLTFCATSGGDTRCHGAATSRIPAFLSQVFTNPVRLLLDTESGNAAFTPPNRDDLGLQSAVKNRSTIDFMGATQPSPLWADPHCTTQLYLQESGTLTAGGPFNSGTALPLSGRLTIQFQVVQFFDAAKPGDCDATLAAIRDCLNDAGLCGGANAAVNVKQQQAFQAMFNESFAAGVLTVSEVATVTNIAYAAQYR